MENREYCKRIADELEAVYNGESGENYNLWDWIAENVLEIEYRIDGKREYKGVKLWVTLGGPNVWIDTYNSEVCLAWGMDRAEYLLDIDVSAALDEMYAEFWEE